ncbi:Low molecular weight protein-tyrosine-phosphatase Ptp [Paraburkholderia nemoris]|uniref:low molecular weight protein-tyrosine-phosphatase n=1 Tax=Paraburkholderia nemoris TaxID=2793076 RepID=UPI00190B4E12|nr:MULTISPECIES: low molecular weight protein-tyrosine-phosphatase [Paraburkholderia]MBK3786692.1 low molecular weight phosphotyrosine protein phosphatase [Paraburkholderia aspalathi]CAE6844873.1 Low molecular weight protein-tyrosine-phosphatase Ptp [Paraburkholderia nemoris]
MIARILIVCAGNVCRSPAAQGLLSRELRDKVVISAGLAAVSGMRIDPVMSEMLSTRGLNMSGHRAKRLDEQMCRSADLILVMEQEQRRVIERICPMTRGRVYRLGEVHGIDIPDPYRRSQHSYGYAMKLIEPGVQDWVMRIANLTGSKYRRSDSGSLPNDNLQ